MQEKSGKTRIDQLVENAGEKLAGNYTRRSFLGRVAGVAGAAMFGGAVVLGEKDAAEASAYAGCFSQYETHICYISHVFAYTGGLHVGPSASAPAIAGYNPGTPFGIQSLRMGAGACNCSDTSCARPSCNGFWFGYVQAPGGWHSGWVHGSCLAQDYYGTTVCGPAHVDYDCMKPKSSCPSYNGCAGLGLPGVTVYSSYYRINASTLYLRYAPGSTAHHYLVTNDIIHRIRAYGTACNGGWSCVTAWNCAWVPYGCHGWIDSCYLGTPVSPGGSGGPGCDCPGG